LQTLRRIITSNMKTKKESPEKRDFLF